MNYFVVALVAVIVFNVIRALLFARRSHRTIERLEGQLAKANRDLVHAQGALEIESQAHRQTCEEFTAFRAESSSKAELLRQEIEKAKQHTCPSAPIQYAPSFQFVPSVWTYPAPNQMGGTYVYSVSDTSFTSAAQIQ